MSRKGTSGFAGILGREAQARWKRIADKIPQWAELAPKLEIPSSLNLEQCSSGAAAEYKASLAGRCGARIADLTGGLGVDSWAFGRIAQAVLHNERDRILSEAVAANFRKLGACNVQFSNFDICVPDDRSSCGWLQRLREFKPDVIFADPARRDVTGRKVFLPEDCSPDIAALMPLLLEQAPTVMVKFSPMMDIKALRTCFADCLRQIHVVCVNGEVKELLCLFGRAAGEDGLYVANPPRRLHLPFDAEDGAVATFPGGPEKLTGFRYLFEPGAGILKAGLFKYVSRNYALTKTGHSAHIYLGDSVPDELSHFGKTFRILDVLPFGKEAFRRIAAEYPHADITARNLPLGSDELRRRIKITPGPNGPGVHIFAVGTDFANGGSDRCIFITQAAT